MNGLKGRGLGQSGALAALLFVVHLLSPLAALGQGAKDKLLDAMPKNQREAFEQITKLHDRFEEARKLKNAVAKKDAMNAIIKERTIWLDKLNKRLAAEGIADWVGHVVVTSSELKVYCPRKGDVEMEIRIPVKGMPNDSKETVRLLDKKDGVRFTISPDAKTPVRFTFTTGTWQLRCLVDGKMLAKISKQQVE